MPLMIDKTPPNRRSKLLVIKGYHKLIKNETPLLYNIIKYNDFYEVKPLGRVTEPNKNTYNIIKSISYQLQISCPLW